MTKVKYVLFISLSLLLAFFVSCRIIISPPSAKFVEKTFRENYDDIMLVTEYIVSSGAESVYLYNSSNVPFADSNNMDIRDENVAYAIQNLFNNGYSLISKQGNTIHYQQWTRFTDAGCGIAYSIDGDDQLDIQYLTQATELSIDGWYYYVEDYSAHRTQ